MKQDDIRFDFDGSKLKAINLYLGDRNSTLVSDLQKFMDMLHCKDDAAQVWKYIDRLEKSELAEQARSAKTQQKPRSAKFADVGGFFEAKGKRRPKQLKRVCGSLCAP